MELTQAISIGLVSNKMQDYRSLGVWELGGFRLCSLQETTPMSGIFQRLVFEINTQDHVREFFQKEIKGSPAKLMEQYLSHLKQALERCQRYNDLRRQNVSGLNQYELKCRVQPVIQKGTMYDQGKWSEVFLGLYLVRNHVAYHLKHAFLFEQEVKKLSEKQLAKFESIRKEAHEVIKQIANEFTFPYSNQVSK